MHLTFYIVTLMYPPQVCVLSLLNLSGPFCEWLDQQGSAEMMLCVF